MLRVDNLSSGYGPMLAVRELSFALKSGELLALVGPNGAGKSTTIMTLAGLIRPRTGRIFIAGQEASGRPARERIALGLALVPEGRRVFAELTVEENLKVGGHRLPRSDLMENRTRVLELFPRLEERLTQRAGSLSGGEQQMLAIGRAIMSGPKILLVDELSLGLMPKVVDECYLALAALRARGLAVLLVDQNQERAVAIADQVVALESGHVLWRGPAEAARRDPSLLGLEP